MKKRKLTNDDCRFVYLKLPSRIKAFLVSSLDGYYTIALNDSLSVEDIEKAKEHEVKHILRNDFDKADCNAVENGVRKFREKF